MYTFIFCAIMHCFVNLQPTETQEAASFAASIIINALKEMK